MSTYKVWYVPQLPMKAFEVEVEDIATARTVLNTLERFSLFEYEERVKPDYADAGGICVRDMDGDWVDADEFDEVAS